MFRTKFSMLDVLVVIVVIFCAALLIWQPWASDAEGVRLQITTPQGSEEYALSSDQEISVVSEGISLTVVIENGAAYVRESSCPDGVCVSSGRVTKVGESVVCAPAGVRITVKGDDGNVDFVAG